MLARSVPPAVAGGYSVGSVQRLRKHPPATAGGTDPIQARRPTLGAKQASMVMRIKVLLLLMTMIVSNSLCLAQTKQCQPARHARLPAISELTYSKARK